MGKVLQSILEVGVGVALEFTPLAPLGTSLILAGTASLAASLLASTPKPQSTEVPLRVPRTGNRPANRFFELADAK